MKWYLCHECGNVWDAADSDCTCPACGNHKNVWDITNMPDYKFLIEREERGRAAKKQPAGVKLQAACKVVLDRLAVVCAAGGTMADFLDAGSMGEIVQAVEAIAKIEARKQVMG